ncbi:hypothetical protein AHAS_Ahas10G0038200 [Arachis hypogaea]
MIAASFSFTEQWLNRQQEFKQQQQPVVDRIVAFEGRNLLSDGRDKEIEREQIRQGIDEFGILYSELSDSNRSESSNGSFAFPVIRWSGVDGEDNVLVMDLLGLSLEDPFVYCGRKFSLKTVLMLADQMMTRIEYVHSKGFLHRDIKPDNFLMGLGRKANQVYIIDFGLQNDIRTLQPIATSLTGLQYTSWDWCFGCHYLLVAKSAITCGSYFTSVTYVEHWCEEHFKGVTVGGPNFSHNEMLPGHIEILVSAVTRINEPDSLYGILQSHKVSPLNDIDKYVKATINRYKKSCSDSSGAGSASKINAQYYQQKVEKLCAQISNLQNNKF